MKTFFKIICVVLAIIMVIPTTAFAAERIEIRGSNFFLKHGAYIDEVSSTKFEVWFTVTAVEGMDVLGASTIKIQRSLDHSNWETVKTYSKDDYSVMTDTDTAGHSGYVTYSGRTAGYFYRAVVTFYAKNSSGTGEYTIATSSI